MSTTAEIREALQESSDAFQKFIDKVEYGRARSKETYRDAIRANAKIGRALALLADMERGGEPVRYGTAPGLQRNCSGCDFMSTPSESKHFRYCPGCGSVIEHPSPTAADAMDRAVDVQEVIRAGDAMANRLKVIETGAGLQAVWNELTKQFRP